MEEIQERYEKKKPPLVKIEVSWINRTVLPNSAPKAQPPKQLQDLLHELVQLEVVKRSVTRYLDGPLDEDTPIFYLPESKK
jgi:hypothetical protein